MNTTIHSNRLAKESSPYLLQHAHNPVDWYSWTDEAWEKARKEDKIVLVSIGYSSCHWCHVMERESFEKQDTADLMNAHFVCIKVDREERPDVDQVYMSAVQLMTGGGGWPLNCFCLPDGRPVYGGTYFPQATWNDLLTRLHAFYKDHKSQAEQYASELTEGIRQSDFIQPNGSAENFSRDEVKRIVDNWKNYFDNTEGGPNRSPKFPLPNNYEFLLHYCSLFRDEEVLQHVKLTLDKMAFGGIYDHAGGGFARYSTDALWKVPHFEKMLYDNAQLVSLYAHAWQCLKDPLYRNVVEETLEFIRREMTSPEGGFYAALDADSEGEEGLYYVWTEEELKKILGDRFPLFADAYTVNKAGHWEKGRYILLRKLDDAALSVKHSISPEALHGFLDDCKKLLLDVRSKRTRPGLDNKLLTSWNALMISALCHAYDAFGRAEDLEAAKRCAELFLSRAKDPDGRISHQVKLHDKVKGAPGFLEDYSFFAEACIALYQSTFDERWLNEARQLADYAIRNFHDAANGMFYYTSGKDPALVARKTEIADNVLPSSNSSLAKALFALSQYFEDVRYGEISLRMLHNVREAMPGYGAGFSNWAILLLYQVAPFYEVVLAGEKADEKKMALNQNYLPNILLAGSSDGNSSLSLLESRFLPGKTLIYVCENKNCRLPVESVTDVISEIQAAFMHRF